MAQLCQRQAELGQLNVAVLLVSFGTLEVAKIWSEESCPEFRLLLNPGRVTYRTYGLERSWLRSWNLKTLWRYIQLLSAGRKWCGIRGDSSQLGGDFIIGTEGIVRLACRSHDSTNRPAVPNLPGILQQLD